MRNFDEEASLPCSLDVEKSLLGSILMSPGLLSTVAGALKPEHFYNVIHKAVYRALIRMHDNGEGIDLVTLAEKLDNSTKAAPEGGWSGYLCTLIEVTATSPQIVQYATIIIDKSARRNVWEAATNLAKSALNAERETGDLLHDIETMAGRLANHCETSNLSHIAPVRTVEIPLDMGDSDDFVAPDCGVSTGWECLDKRVRIARGKTTVVTGIPNDGKSLFVNQMVVQIAAQQGWKWAIFSPESYPFRRLAARLVELVTARPVADLTTEHRRETVKWLNEHFVIIDSGEKGISLTRLIRQCREIVAKRGIAGWVIDPWNWVKIDSEYQAARGTESDAIGNALTDLVGFGRRMNLAQIVVAHPAKQERDKGKNAKYRPVAGYDITGSANWYNKPDNGITVYRNMQEGHTEVHAWKIKDQPIQGTLGRTDLVYRSPGLFVKYEPPPVDTSNF